MQTNDTMTAGSSTGARPTLLTVLCILTFIAVGLGILGSILLMIGAGAFLSNFGGLAAGAGAAVMIPSLLLTLARGVGAYMMWKLKKVGFFIYAGSAIITSIVLPLVLAGSSGLTFWSFFFPALFIGLYSVNLKVLK